jgi:preprotein translocase subunit SecG
VLTDALVVVDVIVALGLIVLILLHSGRGGGLSDMFGASSGSSAAGSTVAERNLDRITVIFVLIFAFVTIALSLRWSG